MKKDIEIPVVKDVYVAVVREWNEEFLSKDWNAYIINNQKTPIEMVLVVSRGYDGDTRTSVMRHGIGVVGARDFAKIELVQEEVFGLHNEFYVTFFSEGKLYEKKYLFSKNTIRESALTDLPVMEQQGILAK
ncbi:hypothetical protein [Sinomicrobium weinanense]|uniref:Phenylalanyl-tRNA synthetase subunit alpha n=1 Tax=Sinomicrobium weinanense TaxID=2842200 RepID=A0A926Q255_9FLAO|nr:hypothetical protein [Sinomicrobium weinanense]MBC9794335.1 hypothetical protein [Sinomicrobium weinanense]MBU3124242.1 hypothetical protein [Sinomicrobium weinanense]